MADTTGPAPYARLRWECSTCGGEPVNENSRLRCETCGSEFAPGGDGFAEYIPDQEDNDG